MSLSARRFHSSRELPPPDVLESEYDTEEDVSHECPWCLGDERECLRMCRELDDPQNPLYDPDSRPRTRAEIEDARLCPLETCVTCGRELTDDELDWAGDGDQCPECVEVAAELAAEDCAESDSCARLRTGT